MPHDNKNIRTIVYVEPNSKNVTYASKGWIFNRILQLWLNWKKVSRSIYTLKHSWLVCLVFSNKELLGVLFVDQNVNYVFKFYSSNFLIVASYYLIICNNVSYHVLFHNIQVLYITRKDVMMKKCNTNLLTRSIKTSHAQYKR